MFPALTEILPHAARRHGAKTALVFGDESFSFEALDAASARFAGGLRALGLKPGERVTLYLPNGPEWIIAYYGILRAGGVVNPVNALNTAQEVLHILADCDARIIVTAASSVAAIDGARPAGLLHIIAVGGAADGARVFESVTGEPPAVEAGQGDVIAHIAYTSGTTGRPKGAAVTHHAVAFNTAMMAQFHMRTAADTAVTALPLPHVYGNVVMNGAFATGGTMVLFPRFSEDAVLAAIQRHRATIMDGVPTMYFYLLNHPDLGRYDVSSLTRCTVGGQTMPAASMAAFEARFGCPLIELWGMTELAGVGTTHPLYGPRRHGSIGIPVLFCEARLASIDDPTNRAPTGEPGELQFRGPMVMTGYWNNPAATAEVLDADGWLSTGDIATIDTEGYITIVDRKKEMILTAGYNVYPAEIERVLAAHPAVAMSAVGKRADAAKGEIAVAFVVRRPGETASEAELIAHCRGGLASYKVPRAVVLVDDLPKTSTGKILRRELHTLDTEAKNADGAS